MVVYYKNFFGLSGVEVAKRMQVRQKKLVIEAMTNTMIALKVAKVLETKLFVWMV